MRHFAVFQIMMDHPKITPRLRGSSEQENEPMNYQTGLERIKLEIMEERARKTGRISYKQIAELQHQAMAALNAECDELLEACEKLKFVNDRLIEMNLKLEHDNNRLFFAAQIRQPSVREYQA